MTELITFILFVFVSGLICNGWNISTRKEMILGFWQKYWESYTQEEEGSMPKYRFPEWVQKPLSSCVLCYASIYGSIIFWSTYLYEPLFFPEKTFQLILVWITFTFSLVFMNNFLHNKLLSK